MVRRGSLHQPRFFHESTIADAWFQRARFSDTAHFSGATFTGGANFDGATGPEVALLDGVRVLRSGQQQERRWPADWREVPDGAGGRTLRLVQQPAVVADADAEVTKPGESSTT
jgi:hypothetical protein